MIFETSIGGKYQICTMDMNGLNFTVLTKDEKSFPHPIRNAIMFVKSVGNFTQIFKFDFESS